MFDMENSITSSPKFKVGQLWRTRSGREARIKRISTMDTSYPILSNIGNKHWHYADGRSCLNNAREHSCDLVELLEDVVTENEAIIAKPITLTQAKKNFMEHLIRPPEDLRREWLHDDNFPFVSGTHDLLTLTKDRLNSVIDKAASWAADKELEACLDWVSNNDHTWKSDQLRRARRPKPPSLKQQALEALEAEDDRIPLRSLETGERFELIRRALESIPDDL